MIKLRLKQHERWPKSKSKLVQRCLIIRVRIVRLLVEYDWRILNEFLISLRSKTVLKIYRAKNLSTLISLVPFIWLVNPITPRCPFCLARQFRFRRLPKCYQLFLMVSFLTQEMIVKRTKNLILRHFIILQSFIVLFEYEKCSAHQKIPTTGNLVVSSFWRINC